MAKNHADPQRWAWVAPRRYLLDSAMACFHCLKARSHGKRSINAAVRGNLKTAISEAKEMVSEIKQSDEAKRVRALLTRRD